MRCRTYTSNLYKEAIRTRTTEGALPAVGVQDSQTKAHFWKSTCWWEVAKTPSTIPRGEQIVSLLPWLEIEDSGVAEKTEIRRSLTARIPFASVGIGYRREKIWTRESVKRNIILLRDQ